jgi:hypothetical protein
MGQALSEGFHSFFLKSVFLFPTFERSVRACPTSPFGEFILLSVRQPVG